MTKAVVLQEKTTDGTETLLPRTSADLVGYSKANSAATNVQEALDELMEKSPGNITTVANRVAAVEGEVQNLQTGQTGTEDRLDALETSVADKAASGHKHAAADITSGTLPAARGGTGRTDGKVAALATARTLDGVQFNGAANVTHYAICSTAAATAEKAAALAGFVLATGARVAIRFMTTNTAANPTLNINATAPRAIRYRNAAVSPGVLAANRTYAFVYDGSVWQLEGDVIQAGTGLTISNAGVAAVKYGTAAGTAAQGNDARLAGGADWTASKPGIVQRVETLEAKPAPTPNGIGAAPAKHAVNHAAGAADPITPAAIGAANAAHAHAVNELSGVLPIAKGGTGAADAATAKANLGINGMVAGVAVADGYDPVNAGSGNVVATAWWQTDGYISNNVLTLRAKLRQNMTNCNCNRTGKYC